MASRAAWMMDGAEASLKMTPAVWPSARDPVGLVGVGPRSWLLKADQGQFSRLPGLNLKSQWCFQGACGPATDPAT
eukprot:1133768-Pelagomonas_calceolata.AAC.1